VPVLNFWDRVRSIFTRPTRNLESMLFSLGRRRTPGGQGVLPGGGQGVPPGGGPESARSEPIPTDIEAAFKLLAGRFHHPRSRDITIRRFLIGGSPSQRAFVVYYEGLADAKRIEREILTPLMRVSREKRVAAGRLPEHVLETLLPAATATSTRAVEEVVGGVVLGDAAIILEGGHAIVVDVKNPPTRQPEEPITERVVRGPHMGFTESHRINTAMVRTFLHDPDLVSEQYTVGRRTMTPVSVMYISDIANPRLVEEVGRRLRSLDVDSVLDSGTLEKLIEDHPVTFVPLVLSTERPDRTAFELLHGAVGIIAGNSPRSLIVPMNFATLLHTSEDVYIRWYYASFLRVIRVAAVVIALLLPAAYLAILNFHQEMIPEQLLVVFTVARASVPFPLIANILLMELAFELIREAGLRLPSAVGPTIGIVGALLLGDMAVRSGLVTPSTVIAVSLTALASFSIPDPCTAFAVRVGRFVFIALAGLLGFYGMALGAFALMVHLAGLRSFGVPFLSPIGPWRPGSPDVILRGPTWTQEMRPIQFRPLDLIRQARYARAWDPGVPGETQAARPQSEGEDGQGKGGDA